jgi:hypothetical protein
MTPSTYRFIHPLRDSSQSSISRNTIFLNFDQKFYPFIAHKGFEMSFTPITTLDLLATQYRLVPKKKAWITACVALWISASLIAIAAIPAQAADSWMSIKWGKTIVGSGKIAEVSRSVPAFTQLVAQEGMRVVLRQGAVQKVVVMADDNVEPLVETAVTGSTLKLRLRPNTSIKIRDAIVIVIDYTTLSSVAASDGVSVELDAAKGASFIATASDGSALRIAEVSATAFELTVKDGASATINRATTGASHRYKVSDAGNLTINSVVANQLNATVSDGAKMMLRGMDVKWFDVEVSDGASSSAEGTAQQQSVKVSDGASANVEKLEGQFARVRASDGGAVKIGKVQSLDVDARDGSVVRYSGEPILTQHVGDGAKLRKI